MKVVKIRIDFSRDKEDICLALANSGYKTWVEEESCYITNKYFVCFEVSDGIEILSKEGE